SQAHEGERRWGDEVAEADGSCFLGSCARTDRVVRSGVRAPSVEWSERGLLDGSGRLLGGFAWHRDRHGGERAGQLVRQQVVVSDGVVTMYLVEAYTPEATMADLEGRLREAAAELSSEGELVRYVRSILV